MPILTGYRAFAGRHYETGTVHNALAYQGVTAPHSGQPYSEALLLGISGGLAFGYFVFDYSGYDPFVTILTRNTFDPLQTLLERLGIAQDMRQTSDPAKGEANLIDVLASGRPAIVWADVCLLPYNDLGYDERHWFMAPLLVYGYENGKAYLADRSSQPLVVDAEVLQRARARVKQDKFRVLALDPPDPAKLASAVQKGIWQCISLYTEAPPKGSKDNFGFAAMQKLAHLLTNTRNKHSWARLLPPGNRLYAALAGFGLQPGLFGWLLPHKDDGAERGLYADFLDEAAIILNKPGLTAAADLFRGTVAGWQGFAEALLPADVPLLKETRDLKLRRRDLFVKQGQDALPELQAINARLRALRAEAGAAFPMSEGEVTALRADLSERLLALHDQERAAVEALQAALA